MDNEKVYDIEKIISSGYGKTARILAEEIVTYLTPKTKNYFDLFVKEKYTNPDVSFLHSGESLTVIYYSSVKNDVKTINLDFSSVGYTWSPIPKLEALEEAAETIVQKVNLIKNKASKNEIRESGFIYAVHKDDCCMFGYIVWK